ncbi:MULTISPECIES: NADPH-dependent FMN reductase [Halomicrobium]|uniref:NADPH-dependent FMN reductase n=2 Tax=Halomicrobium mukohataei TaxID=57705 RepID=C7NWV2_HALMD|nr:MULTISPECIES: NAD(P)H-dependent oxidoreductase [Halomicrobium]ACV48312.1 NADPH-dependent FMN reductase [Halomicrobium mukohataei DSM 12286]QCD66728.1 NAD(P)H-dependent oxidoreductase [Halomicrobium mukohataei]QFR21534.1 FMN reductase [Halomicrobium sp. ZPS1]
MTRTNVVGICGSLREGSYTRQSLQIALTAAQAAGGDTDLLDLREWDLPVFDPDAEDAGDAAAFRERIREADSILLGTPVYHGSFSTPMKNALDYCGFDEFENKTVGLLCVAGGGFPVTALEHLRSVGRSLDCWVIPHQAALPRASSAFEDGQLVDEAMRDRVETLGREAVQYANIEPDPQSIESCENVGADD